MKSQKLIADFFLKKSLLPLTRNCPYNRTADVECNPMNYNFTRDCTALHQLYANILVNKCHLNYWTDIQVNMTTIRNADRFSKIMPFLQRPQKRQGKISSSPSFKVHLIDPVLLLTACKFPSRVETNNKVSGRVTELAFPQFWKENKPHVYY